jgi:hypothetical protein
MDDKKPVGFTAYLIFSGPLMLVILSSIILLPMQSAFADSYDDGYDEGCYDAGRDLKGLMVMAMMNQ